MASKDFAKNLKRDTRSMKPAPDPVLKVEAQEPAPAAVVPAPKKKRGRPKTKTDPERTINIAIPVEVLEKVDIAKVCYGNNLTAYVNAVIKADLEAHLEEYERIKKTIETYQPKK